jgi:hypothetical protein
LKPLLFQKLLLARNVDSERIFAEDTQMKATIVVLFALGLLATPVYAQAIKQQSNTSSVNGNIFDAPNQGQTQAPNSAAQPKAMHRSMSTHHSMNTHRSMNKHPHKSSAS